MSHRVRWGTASLLVGGFLAFVAVIPVFGAETPDVDRLRMTDQVDAFFHGDASYNSSAVDARQTITPSSGCQIGTTTGALVTLGASGAGAKGPGIFDHGLGVKSGGANGTPCSQTEGKEKLVITSKNSWHALRLDVEVKGNAWVVVELSGGTGGTQTHQLLTGSAIATYNSQNSPSETPIGGLPYKASTSPSDLVAACANPSDSGPDSTINDNCMWAIDAGMSFKTVTIYVKQGSVSLEGGNDFAAFNPSLFASGAYDSLFYRAGPPIARDDSGDTYETDEDVLLDVEAPGILANDSDPLGGVLTPSVVSQPSHGTLTIFGTDGSFKYMPDADYNGPDSFTYRVNAGGESSAPATVSIQVDPVNDEPTIDVDSISAVEDMSKVIQVGAVASDIDGPALTFASGATSLTYTPQSNVCGENVDTLDVTVIDGAGGTASKTLAVNVDCVNDNPVPGPDSYAVNERTSVSTPAILTVDPDSGLLVNDTDVDSPSLTATAGTPTPSGAMVTVYADGSFTYTPAIKSEAFWQSLQDSGEFSYVDSWQYTVDDNDGGSATGMASVTVNRVVCSNETVSDVDGQISGSFAPIGVDVPCKAYTVDASQEDGGSVTLDVNPTPGQGVVFFRGFLSFNPVTLDGAGRFSLGIEYDPDPEDATPPRTLLVCADPVFSSGGLILSADLGGTGDGSETWCLAGETTLASAETDGELVTVFQVYGKEDPKFVFK